MSNSDTLLKLFNRIGPRVPARSTQPNPVFSSAAECRPPGLLLMLHPSVRHYAANRVSRSTGSEAEREVKSTGLDNLHYSRADSRSVRAGDRSSSSTGRIGSSRTRRPQVRIAEGSRELQTEHRRKAKGQTVPQEKGGLSLSPLTSFSPSKSLNLSSPYPLRREFFQ